MRTRGDTVRDERGSGLMMASVVAAIIVVLTGALVLAGLVRAAGERTRGAADLAALAGAATLGGRVFTVAGGQEGSGEQGSAGAEGADRAACAEAEASARLNGAEVTGCRVAGDEVEYVLTVAVRTRFRVAVWTLPLEAHANAGTLTGAPE